MPQKHKVGPSSLLAIVQGRYREESLLRAILVDLLTEIALLKSSPTPITGTSKSLAALS